MKMKWNTAILLLCTCVMCIGLAGCGEKTENSEVLSIDTIKNVVIETGDNDIIVESTDNDVIKASIIGYEEKLFVQEGDTVRIKLPISKGGVHLSEPQPLYIYIPSGQLVSFKADSEFGNIQIESVITNMAVHTEYGSIAVSGLQGTVTVKTQSGEIKSDSIPVADIIRGFDNIGARYSGTLGNSRVEHKINLSSEYGNIELTK